MHHQKQPLLSVDPKVSRIVDFLLLAYLAFTQPAAINDFVPI